MKIDDDHMYHGAALIQIAEAPQFTAINSLQLRRGISRSAYRINDGVGVYFKYSTKPNRSHDEYVFTFRQDHLDELDEISTITRRVFVALVCVKGREICCLPLKKLKDLLEIRRRAKRVAEDQHAILVTMPANRPFQVYVNAPGVKNKMAGTAVTITRNGFPRAIFD